MTTTTTADTVRELNDRFRRTLQGGRMMLTVGVQSLPPGELMALCRAIRSFDGFTLGNDPHGEHDFGRVEVAGKAYFWKIDYYAPDMAHGSDDPADPRRTVRVMTVMQTSEY